MHFTDSAIILTLHPFSESMLRASVLTQSDGVWSGLVRRSRGKATGGALQPGNVVEATWRGRLAEHLGQFGFELTTDYAAQAMRKKETLLALASATALTAAMLPERHSEPELYSALQELLNIVQTKNNWQSDYVRYELLLLARSGFPMDFTTCAATGSAEDLIYVSPKSARAVCAEAGAPYHDKLLPLPAFLLDGTVNPNQQQINDSLILTGYFLEHFAAEVMHKKLPDCRNRLVKAIRQSETV